MKPIRYGAKYSLKGTLLNRSERLGNVRLKANLPLTHKLRAQHESLDPVELAVDFLRVAGQADRLDERAALQRLARALDGQVLDQRHLIPIAQHIADRSRTTTASSSPTVPALAGVRRADPFSGRFVIDIVFVGHRACPYQSSGGSAQSIGFWPCSTRKALAREKGLEPKSRPSPTRGGMDRRDHAVPPAAHLAHEARLFWA
ncbi:unnamed protein product [Acanthosepion pharaonis]|uniref:Uncharacterized protein n=1 Tax=Acanthosepion pharaonis TaxID=158019 RepID=A0A812DEG5_ACAPH|nr:unnamed protein product [Sepia pharaonis]